jgi:hypothetical protein
MKLTLLYLKEKALSRLGICSLFGSCIWLAALSYQTSFLPGTSQNRIEGDAGGGGRPEHKPTQLKPKEILKEVVLKDT